VKARMNFGIIRDAGDSQPAGRLSVSEEGLCFMELHDED
jgi:hypothetical protein